MYVIICVCIVYHKMRSKYQDELKSSKWPKTSVIWVRFWPWFWQPG